MHSYEPGTPVGMHSYEQDSPVGVQTWYENLDQRSAPQGLKFWVRHRVWGSVYSLGFEVEGSVDPLEPYYSHPPFDQRPNPEPPTLDTKKVRV